MSLESARKIIFRIMNSKSPYFIKPEREQKIRKSSRVQNWKAKPSAEGSGEYDDVMDHEGPTRTSMQACQSVGLKKDR